MSRKNLETFKRHKAESEGELEEMTEVENNKGKGKVKGITFEIQEYEF